MSGNNESKSATNQLTADRAIGLTVNQYLFDAGITQTRLAKALGLSGVSVSNKVRGQVGWSATELLMTARLLGLAVEDIMPIWHEAASLPGQDFEGWVPAPFVPGKSRMTPFRSNQNLEPSVP